MSWIGFKTMLRRECRVVVHFWVVTLAPPAITTVLYFAIFGKVIGDRIGLYQGVGYSEFIAPGLIVLWVIPYSFGHTASGFLGARLFKYIEEVLVSPLKSWVVITAYVAGGVIRGVLVGLIVALISTCFTKMSIYSAPLSLVALLLTATISALAGMVAALTLRTFDQINLIQTLVLLPLTVLGGVFTSFASLPPLAQHLTLANPMFYMVNAFRLGISGESDVNPEIAFAVITTLGVILLLLTLFLRNIPESTLDR